jgi:hypothetical protein
LEINTSDANDFAGKYPRIAHAIKLLFEITKKLFKNIQNKEKIIEAFGSIA